MDRKIQWNSNVLDEIELVYGKAEDDETIGKLLEQFEEKAMKEARENCDLLTTANGVYMGSGTKVWGQVPR